MIKASVTTAGWVPDNVFLGRIKEAYRVWLRDFEPETSFLWSELIPAKRKAVHDALLGDGDLQTLLSRPRLTDLYYGVDNLCAEFKSETPSDGMAQRMNDLLYVLTVWVGNSRLANPEGGLRYATGAPPTAPSVQHMLRMLPKLDFPNPFPGEVGLKTPNGVASERAFQSYYQAARIRDYLRVYGGSRCLELGAGMGRTAYYALKLGIEKYCIVDLPLALVGQAVFLAGALGPDAIELPGEAPARIKLAAPQALLDGDESFDLVFNADSLPEMSRSYAESYISFVRRRSRVFLSINHEANEFTVRELANDILFTRHPYPLRAGYIEELGVLPPQ